MPRLSSLLCLVGPTGSGKTAVGVRLCELLGGEIVSADSMQIYRGCDVGSAKPTDDEQRRARHHLIDIVEPWQSYSAAAWARDAGAAIDDISARGKLPIVVGGTGFYLKALLAPDTLAVAPPNPALRQELEARVEEHGAQWAHDTLLTRDPAAAARLHPNDTRRVIRALEVAASRPAANPAPPMTARVAGVVYGLEVSRDILYRRLEARIDAMLDSGFMAELAALVALAGDRQLPALRGLGYKQMLPALNEPACFDDCVALWKRDTRRYAKRQFTWFRHQLPTHWLQIDAGADPDAVAVTIADLWRERDAAMLRNC